MTLTVYAASTSVAQGAELRFRLTDDGAPTRTAVRVEDTAVRRVFAEGTADGPDWTLSIPLEWPSSLYRAVFADDDQEAYFVVRTARPGMTSPILVSIPFATWQAYNRFGIAGEGMYWTEQPDRASRVTFDRAGGGPAGDWEDPFVRWLADQGRAVEYCSGTDLHDGSAALDAYRLLLSIGHDEYWSAEMRDRVEAFIDGGGNVAFFTGNTCWWQVRFEDNNRTLICHRDAAADPMSRIDPRRTTVEWSSAPVDRPENSLTGVSFRNGAGCWENFDIMPEYAYTAHFPEHWVFEGTGLREGDAFGAGAIGYETDAADFELVDDVPRVTGRDGTPPTFVILASADLREWRRYGQGGHATMGVFTRGLGAVFNAATVGWATSLPTDPVLGRITRNVIDRLSMPRCPGRWDVIGRCDGLRHLVACEGLLFGTADDDRLWVRELCGQNLRWRPAGSSGAAVVLAAPREVIGGCPVGLYAATADQRLLYRVPTADPGPWEHVGSVPPDTVALAASHDHLFATTGGDLWRLPFSKLELAAWEWIDEAPAMRALANANGRLYGLADGGGIRTRLPLPLPTPWRSFDPVRGLSTLTAHAGRLVAGDADGLLWWREVLAPHDEED